MVDTPNIGPRIKAIRKQRKLTLDALSEQSGVSKSVLSELENAKGNPTFATLWSVAKALGIDLSQLTDDASEVARAALEVLTDHFTPEIKSRDGNCVLRILGPAPLIGAFEWYDITVAPGGVLKSAPHAPGTWEHLTATRGAFEVASGDLVQRIGPGDTVRYPADIAHRIANPGDQPATGFLVVAKH